VREGIASDVVVDVAREYAASLIVLATRARTGMARVLLGSVADSVLGRAGVPLLLTRIGARSKRAARPSEG
jgi:nucleotide-binding universal stress UspA family protein